MKKTFIYILRLTDQKFYIGRTNNLNSRINSHFNGNGSIWTKKYPPVKLEKVIEINDNFQEDVWFKKYVDKYGINNVRGSAYSSIILDENEIKCIQKEIRNAKDLCFICGKDDHFISDCKQKKRKYEDNKDYNQPKKSYINSTFNNFTSTIKNFLGWNNENTMQIED